MNQLKTIAAALEQDRYTRTVLADGSGVLLDIEGTQVLTLNETGIFLLQAISEGIVTIAELTQRLTEFFDVETGTAQQDVNTFVADLIHFLDSEQGCRT